MLHVLLSFRSAQKVRPQYSHERKRAGAPDAAMAAELRNRIVMGAMHTRLETLDRPTERVLAAEAVAD